MFMVSYWALGNPQIFFNVPPAVNSHRNDSVDTKHSAFNFHKPNQTQLILLVIIYLFIDTFLYKQRHELFKWLKLRRDGSKALKADIDEGLAPYWEAISGIE